MNFDVDAQGNPIVANGTGIDATAYLNSYGITLANVNPSGPTGQVAIVNWSNAANNNGSDWIDENVLVQNLGGAVPGSYTMDFSTPLQSISFTRIATPPDLLWLPEWSATAYVGNNAVDSAGEDYLYHYVGGGTAAQNYTLSGDGITSLTIYANGWHFTGIGGVPLANFVLTTVPEPSTFVLLVAGAVGLLGYSWRRRK